MIKKKLFFLLPLTVLCQQAIAAEYTNGDEYNGGESKHRSSDGFQSNKAALEREERADGLDATQRKTFLTKETRKYKAAIENSAMKKENFSSSDLDVNNVLKVAKKGEIQNIANSKKYDNGLSSKSEQFGQRVERGTNKRVIAAFDNGSSIQDSTYIQKDSDMDWEIRRLIDCSGVTMTITEMGSCPSGTKLAQNTNAIEQNIGKIGAAGYGIIHRWENEADRYGGVQLHNWDYASYRWRKTKLTNGYNLDDSEEQISSQEYAKGLTKYKVTYRGKGKVYALTEDACKRKINTTDPSTYTSRDSVEELNNCAKACTNNRTDEGKVYRKEIVSCASYDKRDDTKGEYIIYKSTNPATVTTEYPQGTKTIQYKKHYLFKYAKGFVYVNADNKYDPAGNLLSRGTVLTTCEVYQDEATPVDDCVRDYDKEQVLGRRFKEKQQQQQNSGSGGTGGAGGGACTTGNCGGGVVTPKEEPYVDNSGDKRTSEAAEAARGTASYLSVKLSDGSVVQKTAYKDNDGYYFLENGNKVYIDYDDESGNYDIRQ